MTEEKQVNPRIPQETFDRLEVDAKSSNTSINGKAADILERYYSVEHSKRQRGEITLMRSIIRKMTAEYPDDISFEQSATDAGLSVLSEMRMQVEYIEIREVLRRMKEWHDFNDFKMTLFENTDHITIKIKYDMGKKWAKFMSFLSKAVIEGAGSDVLEMTHDEFGISVKIPHHAKT